MKAVKSRPTNARKPDAPTDLAASRVDGTGKRDWIWMDGRFVKWNEANVHVLSLGLHYGAAAFEGMRCYQTPDGPALFRLDDHLNRMYRSAAYLHMELPYDQEKLAEACRELILKNDLADAYVRPIAFYGAGGMNFSFRDNPVHVAVAAWPWGAFLGDEGLRRGIRLKTVSWRKTPSTSVPSSAKLSGNYVNSLLAFQEATRAGFDEALLLNDAGTVAEGSGENVFAVRNGVLTTPPPADDNLPGLTRDSVMQLARDLGYPVQEATLSRPDLLAADEVFLTGTAAEVTPVRELDWFPIGEGSAGPVTLQLQRAYFEAVRGRNHEHRDWLAYARPQISAMNGGI